MKKKFDDLFEKDYLTEMSFKLSPVPFGTNDDMNNGKIVGDPHTGFYTLFQMPEYNFYVMVAINLTILTEDVDGEIMFGTCKEKTTEFGSYRKGTDGVSIKAGSGTVLLFNRVAYVALQTVKHSNVNSFYFTGADSNLERFYRYLCGNIQFLSFVKSCGFEYDKERIDKQKLHFIFRMIK